MVDVRDVPRGADCDCVCAECKQPLVAAKGEQRVDYFRHAAEACAFGRETAIHAMAKQVLADHRHIEVKPREVMCASLDAFGTLVESSVSVDKRTSLNFDSVALEQWLPEGIRADAYATAKDECCVLEVWVRHKVDEQKLAKLRQLNKPALEIDLHDVNFCTVEELVELVIASPARTTWLHYPGHAEAVEKAHREVQVALNAARDAKARARAAARWEELSSEKEQTRRNSAMRHNRRASTARPVRTARVPSYEGPTLAWGRGGDSLRLDEAAFMRLPQEALADLRFAMGRRYDASLLEPEAVVAQVAARWCVSQAVVREVLIESGFVTPLD